MKEVRTLKKYKCDFCTKRSIKSAMERHEKRCFRNPDRYCDACGNTGYLPESYEASADNVAGMSIYGDTNCSYCAKFDPQVLIDIERYEKGE